jgi:hypothetical protein
MMTEHFQRYLRAGRMHPALLFAGNDAAGKRRLLRRAVRALFCESGRPETLSPCDRCRHCRKLEAGHHPDFLEFPEPDGEPIKIESVREVTLAMETPPTEAKLRIAFIDECHRMTAPAANALLKSLEEPKPDRYFWLASTQPASLLPTVRSRCVSFRFGEDGGAEAPTPETARRFAEELTSWRHGADAAASVEAMGSKDVALDWLRWLRREIRDALVVARPTGPLAGRPLVELFRLSDELTTLEEQLRSNASWGLLLGAFARRHFATPPAGGREHLPTVPK